VLPSEVAYSYCLYSIWEKLGEWGRRAEVLFLHELVMKEVFLYFVINKVMMDFSKKKKK
jgi:hypothetical protein